MKTALFVALLILTGCATAPKHAPGGALVIPDTSDDTPMKLDPRVFASFNEAAVAAIQTAYDSSNVYEHAGGIIETPEFKFQITVPVTSYSGDQVEVGTFKKKRYVQVADYHTHPCLPYTHFVKWLSPEDTDHDDGTTAVLGNMCTGEVTKWTPGFDPVGNYIAKNIEGDPVALTTGQLIGKIAITKIPRVLEQPSEDAPTLLCPVE